MPYRRELEGRAIRAWYNMNERAKKDGYEYSKGDVVSKEDFLNMVIGSEVYNSLYNNWKKKNFEYGLTPTIDRIDSLKGYGKDNIQLLTFSDNARKNHDRESFKDLKSEMYLKKEKKGGLCIMNKLSRLLYGDFVDELNVKKASVNESEEHIMRVNAELSKMAMYGTEMKEHTINRGMVKAANFALEGSRDMFIQPEKLANVLAERFNTIEKMASVGIYNEAESNFIKLSYLCLSEDGISDEERAKLLIINDKTFMNTNENNYDLFCKKASEDEMQDSAGEEDNISEILTDRVMNMIREEMGDDVADGLNENRDNVYNALPLPYKERIKDFASQGGTPPDGSKTANALLTLGLTGLGAALGRSGNLSGSKIKPDRTDGMIIGATGGNLMGQFITDYQNKQTPEEIVSDSVGVPLLGLEGGAFGSLVGYNYNDNNRLRNTIIGGASGMAATELIKRMM